MVFLLYDTETSSRLIFYILHTSAEISHFSKEFFVVPLKQEVKTMVWALGVFTATGMVIVSSTF